MNTPDRWIASPLVDLSSLVVLEDLWSLEDPELDASTRRMLARIDDPRDSFGGFNPQREG